MLVNSLRFTAARAAPAGVERRRKHDTSSTERLHLDQLPPTGSQDLTWRRVDAAPSNRPALEGRRSRIDAASVRVLGDWHLGDILTQASSRQYWSKLNGTPPRKFHPVVKKQFLQRGLWSIFRNRVVVSGKRQVESRVGPLCWREDGRVWNWAAPNTSIFFFFSCRGDPHRREAELQTAPPTPEPSRSLSQISYIKPCTLLTSVGGSWKQLFINQIVFDFRKRGFLNRSHCMKKKTSD